MGLIGINIYAIIDVDNINLATTKENAIGKIITPTTINLADKSTVIDKILVVSISDESYDMILDIKTSQKL